MNFLLSKFLFKTKNQVAAPPSSVVPAVAAPAAASATPRKSAAFADPSPRRSTGNQSMEALLTENERWRSENERLREEVKKLKEELQEKNAIIAKFFQ